MQSSLEHAIFFWSLATGVYIWSLGNNHGTHVRVICKHTYVLNLSVMLKKQQGKVYFVESGSAFTSFHLFTDYCFNSFISVPVLLTNIITSSRKRDMTPDLSEFSL